MKKTLPQLGKLTRNGYRRSKGYISTIDDKLVQKHFWLGHDPVAAVEKIQVIEHHAQTRTQGGQLVWTVDQIAAIENRFIAIDLRRADVAVPVSVPKPMPVIADPVFPPGPLPPLLPTQNLSLHHGLDQYADFVQTRNDIALKTREMIRQRVQSLKYHLPDLHLPSVVYEQLQQLRSVITARPDCRRRADAKVKTPAEPISIMTTRNWLTTLGQAFAWFRKTGRWRKPLELETDELNSVFFLAKEARRRLCHSRDEQQRLTNPKPTLTLDELCVYYRLALPAQRMYLLMGSCLGWRQRQIADLRKSDIVKRGNDFYVRFIRTKTGVGGDLWLCPELAQMLIERVSQTPAHPENYALLTENNMPLVHVSENGYDTDAIKLSWLRLRWAVAKTGVQSLPFDSLRRFGGQAVANIGDPFLAQVFLAQVPESILEQHYAGRGIGLGIGTTAFEKVHEVQRKVHGSLRPMFAVAESKIPLEQLVKKAITKDLHDDQRGQAA